MDYLRQSQSFRFLSDQYYDLVTTVFTETIKGGNINTYIGSEREDIQDHYKKITRWSDFNIILPLLFNFFHAIELNLKGLLFLTSDAEKYSKPTHNLSVLLGEFSSSYKSESKLIDLFRFYIHPDHNCNLLYNFYLDNDIKDSSVIYEIFRYPSDRNFNKSYDFRPLKRKGGVGVDFMQKLIVDIELIQKETRKIVNLKPDKE